MQTIYLDISNKGVIPTIYAKQGDVGRKFQVVLTDAGLPYIPVGGSAFSVWYSGASGEGNYTEVGDKSAFSVSENKVAVEMISQMLSNDGDGVLSLVLNDPNRNQISTWNIPYICEFVPGSGSEEAKSYYTAFSEAVKNLPYPDSSLSAIGKAADAAATGAALAGKAPAGYGLGEDIPGLTDLDTVTKSGNYRGNVKLPGYSDSIVVWCRADMSSPNYGTQHLYSELNGGMEFYRTKNNGVWGELECVNPPMIAGVEYRTTERWKGLAVFTKLVDFGTLPSSGISSTDAGVPGLNVCSAIGSAFSGTTGEYSPIPIGVNGEFSSYFYINNDGMLSVRAMKDMSSYTGVFVLKFVKD